MQYRVQSLVGKRTGNQQFKILTYSWFIALFICLIYIVMHFTQVTLGSLPGLKYRRIHNLSLASRGKQ